MAKSNATTPDAPAATRPALSKSDQTKLAMTAITCITGCGDNEAKARIAKLDAAQLEQIATLEHSGNRRDVIPLLYQ